MSGAVSKRRRNGNMLANSTAFPTTSAAARRNHVVGEAGQIVVKDELRGKFDQVEADRKEHDRR